MFLNYLTIALRNVRRNSTYSLINIVGLAVGMACCLVMLLFVRDETSYDRVYSNAKDIYRLTPKYYKTDAKGSPGNANSPLPAQPAMIQDLTGIKYAVRVFNAGKSLVKYQSNIFSEENIFFADKDYFQMFQYQGDFLAGDRYTALLEPYSIVITDALARKYFGNTIPFQSIIGKSFRLDNKDDYQITGIIKTLPHGVHLRFDGLLSFSTVDKMLQRDNQDINALWGYLPSSSTYIQLESGIMAASVEAKFPAFVQKYLSKFQETVNLKVLYEIMPLCDIHLYPQGGEFQPQSSIQTVSIFGGAALFILAIACMNFMNLATARSQHRAREVGVRKVLGAHRRQLVAQFLTESVLISLLALVLSLVLVELALSPFNAIIGKTLSVEYTTDSSLVLGFVFIALVTGIIAGSYPAFVLSRFAPGSVLKGRFARTTSGTLVRKSLVVVQFVISITLIIGVIVVVRQLEFTDHKDLGLQPDRVLKITLPQDSVAARQVESLRQAMICIPGVQSLGTTSAVPGGVPQMSTLKPEGAQDTDNKIAIFFTCESGFVPTMSMTMKEGRNFSDANSYDRSEAFIINEATAEAFGWKSPLGKRLVFSGRRSGTVIGVVKNFHFESLRSIVRPAIMMMPKTAVETNTLLVRTNSANIKQTLAQLETVWKQHLPDWAFEVTFVDQIFAKLYAAEQRLGGLLSVFAGLAIALACLGLFGLAAFSAEIRTKEIGVRKVLGASVASIIGLLSKDFLKLVGIAIVVAVPLAWYGMSAWLQDFAYRVELSWWMFALAASASVVIAFLTVAGQSWRAAQSNPVQSLRSE